MSYKFNLDDIMQDSVTSQEEEVTLDEIIQSEISKYGKFAVIMDMVGAIAQLQPTDEVTLIDIALDAIGAEEVTLDAVDGEEPETSLSYDEEALNYAVGVTLDFASQLGLSQSSVYDLMDEDPDVAMDELQALTSLVNGAIPGEGNLGTLVAMSINADVLADSILDEGEETTLDSIAMDWSFSRTKPAKPASKGMKIVPCMRREKGEQPKKGFCKYPKTLLEGKKYRKRGGKKADPKRKALKKARKFATDRMANAHRSQTMKLKAGSTKRHKKASKASNRKG